MELQPHIINIVSHNRKCLVRHRTDVNMPFALSGTDIFIASAWLITAFIISFLWLNIDNKFSEIHYWRLYNCHTVSHGRKKDVGFNYLYTSYVSVSKPCIVCLFVPAWVLLVNCPRHRREVYWTTFIRGSTRKVYNPLAFWEAWWSPCVTFDLWRNKRLSDWVVGLVLVVWCPTASLTPFWLY